MLLDLRQNCPIGNYSIGCTFKSNEAEVSMALDSVSDIIVALPACYSTKPYSL